MSEAGPPEDRAAAQPYQTVAGVGASELTVRRSRFLAEARPVSAPAEARALVLAAKMRHPDARHVVFGMRLGRAPAILDRWSDDGEPSRTGGYPLWQLLDGGEVTDALLLVVRYFGGVKLGMGGLARAYRDAGRAALLDAAVVLRFPERRCWLRLSYAAVAQVEHALAGLGVRVLDSRFAEAVVLELAVRRVDEAAVRARLATLLMRAPEDVFSGAPAPISPGV